MGDMTFTALELWIAQEAAGRSSARDIRTMMRRGRLWERLSFTPEERERIGLKTEGGQFQFDPNVILSRELDDEEKSLLVEMIKETLGTFQLRGYRTYVSLLEKLGMEDIG